MLASIAHAHTHNQGGVRLFSIAHAYAHNQGGVCVSSCCSVTGDRQGLSVLATEARGAGKHNVAFLALFLLGEVKECMQLLVEAGRCAHM